MQPPTSSITYLPALDGLRAFAVVAVIAFHTGLVSGGWIGVDLFFVLSGYLITSVITAELERTGSLSLQRFWVRRFRRLVPALVALLAMVVAMVVLGLVELRRSSVFGAVTYTTNWVHIVLGEGYWDQFRTPDPLTHLWSLAVEEQVYLVWPVVALLAGRRFGRRGVAVAAVLGAAASFGAQAWGLSHGWSIDRLYQGTDTRAAAFLLGAALVGRTGLGRRWGGVVAAAGAGVLVWATFALHGETMSVFHGPLQLCSLGGAAVVVWAAGHPVGLLVWGPLRAIGRWSYGIYLFHWPLAVTDQARELSPWLRFVAVTALATVIAAVSYRFVEQPIRRHGLRPASRPIGYVFAVAVATLAFVVTTPAAPALVEGPTLPPVTIAAAASSGTVGTEATGGTIEEEPPRLLVVGDSVPALAAPQIVEVAQQRGYLVEVYADPGCVASPDDRDQTVPGCAGFVAGVADRVADGQPDVVAMWWGGTGSEFMEQGVRYDSCTPEGRAAFTRRVDRLAELAGDARLVLVGPAPRSDLGRDDANGTACQVEVYRREAERLGATLIATDELVCPSHPDDCDRIPRTDGMHYTPDGAVALANLLLDRIA